MGETADKIESYIDEHREHLGSNLRELEGKVKSATNWRTQVGKHTGLALGLAVGTGALLASLTGPSMRNRRPRQVAAEFQQEAATLESSLPERRPSQILGHVNHMKSALIDVAAAGLVNYVDQLIPGFKQQIEKRTQS